MLDISFYREILESMCTSHTICIQNFNISNLIKNFLILFLTITHPVLHTVPHVKNPGSNMSRVQL